MLLKLIILIFFGIDKFIFNVLCIVVRVIKLFIYNKMFGFGVLLSVFLVVILVKCLLFFGIFYVLLLLRVMLVLLIVWW